jgi:hypothetical protein
VKAHESRHRDQLADSGLTAHDAPGERTKAPEPPALRGKRVEHVIVRRCGNDVQPVLAAGPRVRGVDPPAPDARQHGRAPAGRPDRGRAAGRDDADPAR